MRWILCCIDGTNSSTWRKKDGSNSHCHKFYRNFGLACSNDIRRLYLDGPNHTLNATDAPSIKKKATNFIKDSIRSLFGKEISKAKSLDSCRIVLVGHSRGGGIVIDVAAQLMNEGLVVYYMGLFDAVDCSDYITGGTVINVRHAYHALRGLPYSRWYFGNTGIGGTVWRRFNTSHGGLGGDLATDPKFTQGLFADAACSTQSRVTGIYPTGIGSVYVSMESNESAKKRVKLCKEESKSAFAWILATSRAWGLPI